MFPVKKKLINNKKFKKKVKLHFKYVGWDPEFSKIFQSLIMMGRVTFCTGNDSNMRTWNPRTTILMGDFQFHQSNILTWVILCYNCISTGFLPNPAVNP